MIDPKSHIRPIGAPAERFGGFRNSLLVRIDPDYIQEDEVGPFAALVRHMATSPLAAQGEQLVGLIEAELATINARVEDCWRDRVAGAIALDTDLVLRTDRLELEAFVAPPAPGERPTIHLSLGAVFALDDLTLFALTSSDVLIPDRLAISAGDPKTGFTPPEPFVLSGAGLDRDGRFFDYRTALEGGIDRAVLTHTMAFTPWRLAQASLLSELALAWVLFHERAHWALGHLDLLNAAGVKVAALAETGQRPVEEILHGADPSPGRRRRQRLESGTHRAMEIEADTQAFLLLCDYAMRLGGAGDRYEATAAAFGAPDDPRVLRNLTFGRCLRVCITAICLACLAFDEARGGKGAPDSATHPRPASRLMSMLINAPLVSPMTKQDAQGRWILAVEDRIDEFGEDNLDFAELVQGIGMALTDLLVISSAIDADFIPLELEEAGAGLDQARGPSAWLRELTTFWVADGVEEPPRVTPAGIELTQLKVIDEALRPTLEALQRRRFGASLSVDVGGIWRDRT